MQQAVHDRDDEYGLSQARGGEINTHTRMCEQGAACACSAVDIWGSAWASHVYISLGREIGGKSEKGYIIKLFIKIEKSGELLKYNQ